MGKNIPVNGPMLKVDTLKTSLKFLKDDDIASNSWLDSIVCQNKIQMSNLHSESVNVCLDHHVL